MCLEHKALEQRILECGITLEDSRCTLGSSMIEQYLHAGLQFAIGKQDPKEVPHPHIPQSQHAYRLLDMGACLTLISISITIAEIYMIRGYGSYL